ncbi:trimethylamine methyltransferase family protein [Roseovarius aestuarii]|uniref:Trimethylamine methyltransferase (MTTB) n=1 Tax=Roseovarius aestuarii TaxID=475083 RepID=A0A1X7BVE7_9RHOB|nr:trimethylamine methyltransferase family protein [Roseovarius aestuarii]SMC13564.1 Trimethylamine methyltransferase (MTTB) [Roseovarius aestuarii]
MPRRARQEKIPAISSAAPIGGRYQPLSERKRDEIIEAAFVILEQVGMADCPEKAAKIAGSAGARIRHDGRVCFPRAMVVGAITRAAKTVNLPGFVEDAGLSVGGGQVHIGTGGAAVEVPDDAGGFRSSALPDLYRMMALVGRAENVHYGVRPLVARDMETPLALDINTGFACLKACPKPIGISFDNAGHVAPVIRLFDIALGRDGRFPHHPFCFGVIVHAVSPLRYAPEGVEIMCAAIEAGMPVQICTAAQAGATSPVTLAGALAQGLAEALAGLMITDLVRPGFPTILAFMPFISDLRTGAMTGGSGEAAVANAAAAQLLLHLGLPSTVSAGMTDAKIPDAQAGYEKGYTIALAAQAGADMINLSVGMLGSIMVASPEALVIDNDMCGAILRSVRGVELTEDGIDLEMIEAVATGPGHYLGEAQTLARMKTEYVYPVLADRQSVQDWQEAGRPDLIERARLLARQMTEKPPDHLPPEREAAIRSEFDIRLPEGQP